MSTLESGDGEQRKAEALAMLAERRKPYVLRGRRALLLALLCTGQGSADDVRNAVDLSADVDPVCLGGVPGHLAKLGIIERAGYVATCRPAAHARTVSVWRLRDRDKAEQWLRDNPAPPEPDVPDEKARKQLGLFPGDGGQEPGEARADETSA